MWHDRTAAQWQSGINELTAQLDNKEMAALINDFRLLPTLSGVDAIPAAIHEGPLSVSGDFRPDALVTLVNGDLNVEGKISTEGVAGFDGNATLIVFGSVTCASVVNDWASLLIVTGDCTVRDWTFAAREDSSFVVGGDFTTPVFVGFDIWVSVGGTARITAGLGYALPLDYDYDGPPEQVTYPDEDWRALARRLGVSGIASENDLVEALENRLYSTGTIRP